MARHYCIIGGGIIGTSTAYSVVHHPHLGPSDSVTLIEGTEIAAGASGKSGGFLALDWHGHATASLAALSFRLHEELAAKHDGDKLWGYRKLDTFSISADTQERASNGPTTLPGDLKWLDTNIIRRSESLGTKVTTAQAHPRMLTHSLARLARENGAKVFIGEAKALEFGKDDRPNAVTVEMPDGAKQRIQCTDVIIAAGPWSGNLATQLIGSRLKRRIDIDGTRAHSIVIKTHEPLSEHALFCDLTAPGCSGEPEIYCRPDGTAYVCGAGDQEPLPQTAAAVRVDREKIEKLKAQCRALSPSHLGDKGIVQAEQACYLPSTRTGPPLVGKLLEGVYLASGHSCWGITLGPGTGRCLAELLIDGQVSSADIGMLKP